VQEAAVEQSGAVPQFMRRRDRLDAHSIPPCRLIAHTTHFRVMVRCHSRTLTYQCRIKEANDYQKSAWIMPFIGGSYKFKQNGVVNLDAKDQFFFYATGVTPAITEKMIGEGSQHAGAFVDAKGNSLDGDKSYRVHMPPNIPIKNFWSFT
jgi:hypothetical protein